MGIIGREGERGGRRRGFGRQGGMMPLLEERIGERTVDVVMIMGKLSDFKSSFRFMDRDPMIYRKET
jgi:hypothetical protein